MVKSVSIGDRYALLDTVVSFRYIFNIKKNRDNAGKDEESFAKNVLRDHPIRLVKGLA